MDSSTVLIVIVAGAAVYGFLNGYKDAAGITATVVSSRAMSPRLCLTLIGLAEFCGPFLFGTAVAAAVGQGIIAQKSVTPRVLLAALGSAIIWNFGMVLLGFPTSSTHALVGGLIGAAWAASGPEALRYGGLLRLVVFLLFSPLVGLVLGYILLKLAFFLARGAPPGINEVFKRLQVFTAVGLALSHGSNDAQKSIGVMAMALMATGRASDFGVPLWTVGIGAGALALGALLGSGPIIRTVGSKIYRLRPVHALTAQMASAVIVLGAGLLGGPVSTPQVVSGSVMGVGSAERLSAVRWGMAGNIALAWLITLPVTALLSYFFWTLLSRFLPAV